MDKEIRKIKIFNYTVAIVFMLIFLTILTIYGLWKWNRTFTVRKWIDNPTERHKIVSDMLTDYELVGMTEKEIVSFLGNEALHTPESFKYPRGQFPDEEHLTYGLGGWIDSEWLIIRIENSIAVEYMLGVT